MARQAKRTSSPKGTAGPPPADARAILKPGGILAIIGVLLYLNTVQNGYVLDDTIAITDHPLVQSGVRGLPGLLTVDTWFAANLKLGYYRPLSLVTFAIEQQFFGGNPGISHLINAILYGLLVFGIYGLLAAIFPGKRTFVLLSTLLFATHPIHTEVVANIKGRDELLSFLGVIFGLWLLQLYLKTGKMWVMVASLVASYLGFLSKETAFTIVGLAPLVVYFSTDRSFKGAVKWALPYAGAIGLFLVQKYLFTHTLTGRVPDDILFYPYAKAGVQMPASLLILFTSVRLLLFPHPLRYDYAYNFLPCDGWSDPGTMTGLAILAAASYFAVRGLRGKTTWGFGTAFFFITIAPALLFVILRGGIMAERILFAPSLGFTIIVACGITKLAEMKMKPAMAAIVALLCVAYSTKTIARNAQWKSNTILFTADIKTGQASAQNWRQYGDILTYQASRATNPEQQHAYSLQAIEALNKALKIHPGFGEAHAKLGVNYYLFQGDIKTAIACYNRAIQSSPAFPESYYYLGAAYHQLGQTNVASYFYNQAVEKNPNYPEARQRVEEMKAAGWDVRVNPLDQSPKEISE